MDYTYDKLSDKTKAKLCSIEDLFINMRASGYTVRDIARKLKKSNQTVSDMNKKYFRQVAKLRNEKLELLQKRIFEKKQERLDFLTEHLRVIIEVLNKKEVYITYERLVLLAIKVSNAINKSENDMLITDILADNVAESETQDKDSCSGTNCPEEKPHNPEENIDVTAKSEISGNAETKNKKSKTDKTKKPVKTERVKKNITNENKKIEENNEKKINPPPAPPPRTRADFYHRALKNKQKAPS